MENKVKKASKKFSDSKKSKTNHLKRTTLFVFKS